MKNVINYYYNLYPETIFQNAESYYFFINNIRYTFIKYKEEIEKINSIYNMHLDILNKKKYVHPIILNKDQQPLTFINNTPYILLQTIYYGSKVTINNIIDFSNITVNESNQLSWSELWSIKNDYLEYQIRMLGKKHPIIRDSFGYFMGLAETAIQLVNTTERIKVPYTYAHKRINKNSETFDLYNPINIIIDIKIRDIAEYFKQSFFDGENIEEDLSYYLNNTKLTMYEYIMFLSRMLYPTYYFDSFEEIIENKKDEKKLCDIINKTNEYERLIKKIYKYYKNILNIVSIEWLE